MGELRYCFEQSLVPHTLSALKAHGLAVVDTDGCEPYVAKAVERGVLVYGYLNAGALERERRYYNKFKNLRLARYDGWDGEYWVDVTDKGWQEHLIAEAKKIKACGAIGLYLDNTDIYYMCAEGFDEEGTHLFRDIPTSQQVYKALSAVILAIHRLGLVVMPNGGDTFVKRFIKAHPGIIATINQEGVFYESLDRKNSTSNTAYYKEWCKWAQKHISGKVRIIEYCTSKREQARIKAYCMAHGWHVYFSKHKELKGD